MAQLQQARLHRFPATRQAVMLALSSALAIAGAVMLASAVEGGAMREPPLRRESRFGTLRTNRQLLSSGQRSSRRLGTAETFGPSAPHLTRLPPALTLLRSAATKH